MALSEGTVLVDRYRIDGLLGAGGMGAVYSAWDLTLNRRVALKENALATAISNEQFKDEAQTLARLRHPHLPAVHDYFILPSGAQYLVMEYIEGDDLGQIVERHGPLHEAQVLTWAEQVCAALTYLHSQQPPIIHRDIKPHNLKLTPGGEIFLVDLGLAKVGDMQAKTKNGALGVTPGFSPLEQYGMGGTDQRSDLYALGATLYTLLTGQAPPESICRAAESQTLIPARELRPDLTPTVARAIEVALEMRPTQRPQSIAEFQALLRGEPASGQTRRVPPPQTAMSPTLPVASRPQSAPSPTLPAAPPSPSPAPAKRPLLWIGGGLAGLLALLLLVWGGSALSRAVQASPTPTLTPTATASPTATATATATVTPTPTPTPLPTATLMPTAHLGDTWTRPADGMVMVYVPEGEFQMGSEAGFAREAPVHTVALNPFWIDRTEVTNAQYAQCVAAEKCTASLYVEHENFNAETQPVVGISWYDAAAYCAWTGSRLPTEAQWEYAARGPAGWEYPWGNTFDGTRLNFCDKNCPEDAADATVDDGYTYTAPVSSYPAGASWVGALDMAGNVREWVADFYDAEYYSRSPRANPTGPESGQSRLLRGGSWANTERTVRNAFRGGHLPIAKVDDIGFRCVRTAASGE